MNDDTDSDPKEEVGAAYAAVPQWEQADIPEYYADTVNLNVTSYGLNLTFGVRSPQQTPRPRVRLHMSHPMAVVLERLLRRMLLQFEADNAGAVLLQPTLLEELRITQSELEELQRKRDASVSSKEVPNDDR